MTETNPFKLVQQLTGGYIAPRCLHVVANLGVADMLDETPRTAAELAALVGAHPDALHRIMSLLASYGIFEVQGDTFRHTPASRLLRSDHPQSMRAFARVFGLPHTWEAYGELEYTVRTGMPATSKTLPNGQWAYYAEHPERSAIFNAAMVGKSRATVAGVTAVYDFSGFGVVGDIGGGLGHLVSAVVDANQAVKGVLFDLPSVIDQVQNLTSDRLTLQSGDFFKDTLPVCDAYVLMDIIHDWADAESLAILQSIRRAAPAHARLLLVEIIIPDDPGPDWSKILDIQMMTMLGGRQRTIQEYKTLFEQSGFSFARQINTGTEFSIIEATPI